MESTILEPNDDSDAWNRRFRRPGRRFWRFWNVESTILEPGTTITTIVELGIDDFGIVNDDSGDSGGQDDEIDDSRGGISDSRA